MSKHILLSVVLLVMAISLLGQEITGQPSWASGKGEPSVISRIGGEDDNPSRITGCTYYVTPSGGSQTALPSNYIFWTGYSYTIYGVVSGLSAGYGYAVCIYNSSGTYVASPISNQTGSTFSFIFGGLSGYNGTGFSFKLVPQFMPNSPIAGTQSNAWHTGPYPTLNLSGPSSSSYIQGSTFTLSWYVSGGINGLTNGGWSSSAQLRFQWYQGSTPLSNISPNVNLTSWSRTITANQSPGSNYRIGVSNVGPGSGLPDGIPWAFSNYFQITSQLQLPPAPSLSSPSNYSIRLNQTPHYFSWDSIAGYSVDQYQIFVDNNSGFGNPEINETTTATNISSYTPLANNIYYWKVRAHNATGWGEFSTTRQLIVDLPPSPPTLISPSNAASITLNSTINFQWNASPDSPIYRYNIRIVAGTNLNATPVYDQIVSSLSHSVSTSGWLQGTYTWGIRAVKATPNSTYYPQLTYEQTISWGNYNTRTFTISSGVGINQSLSCTATRIDTTTIYALPSSTEYGGLEPSESEKNLKANFKIVNNGSASITLDDVGVYVTGGTSTNFRITLGTSMTLAAGQVSSLFDKRGYLMDNQLTGGSTTTYTGQIQVKTGSEWRSVTGTGSQCSFTVAPRPAIANGMLVKRPRNINSTNSDAAAVYKTQYGRKWQGTASAFDNLYPTWDSEFYVYPLAEVNALSSPSTPTHDSTIPRITGRNLLYEKTSTGEVFIIEPEPNTSTPLKSRWFASEEAFNSYGYGAGVLAQESIALSNSQVDWVLTQYPRGTDISVFGFGLAYPTNSIEVTSQSITFDWNDVANVRYYRLYVDDDPSFSSPEIDTAEHPYVPQSEMHDSQYEICGNWLPPYTVFYWKVSATFNGGGYIVSSIGQFQYNPELMITPAWLPVYRAYKNSEVDHFYCTSSSHLQYAIDSLFVFEKVEGFLAGSPYIPSNLNSDLKAVYRLSTAGGASTNEKSHFYTTDDNERNSKIADDWYYEGIIGFTEDNDNFVPMYFLYRGGQNPPALNDYFYTTSEIEKNRAVSNGYTNMGIMCYLSLDGDGSTEASPITQPTAGRGINPYNGNLSEYSKDVFSIPGGKMSLDLSFSYNSYSTKLTAPINPIGNGWNHNYQSYIYITSTRLFVFWPDGTIHIYNASSPYNAITPGVYDTMQRITTTQYRITKKDQTTLTFNVLAGYSTVATLAGIQDRNSNYLSMVYDANDRLNYVTDRFGRRLQFYYYSDTGKTHLVHHVTDTAGGRTVYFNYDSHFNLVSFQDAKGYSTQYTYEDTRPYAHLLTSIAYPNGNVVSCLYDSSQRVTNQTIGNTGQSLVVSGYSSPTSRTVSDGGITSQYSYYQGVYAKIQQLTTPDVAAGFQYSDTNNPTLPTSITDGSGNTTSLTYDTRGNVLTISKPGGISHQYTYNTINDITQYRDPLNHYSYFGYTSGNLSSVQTPRGTTNYQYGSYGKLTQMTNPIGQRTTFSYDSYDNIASVTQPLGLTTSYSYDAVSRVTSTTNPMSQTTTYQYDENDNLMSLTEFGDLTSYTYDWNDNLLSVSKNGQTTSMQYNNMGLMSQISNPMGNISYLYYNPNGTLQSIQKPVGSISYSYNNDGTVSAVNSQDTWANYAYNGNRKVTNISDNNGSISFGYDTNNRVTSINSNYGFTGSVSYTYDVADNITSMTYGGHAVQYSYYADNLLHTVTDWNGRTTTFTYRNDGSLDHITYPNGIVCNNGYDAAGRLTSLANAGTTNINNYTYTLNALGFHTSVNQSEPLEPFPMAPTNLNCTYDNANRILTAGNATFTHNGNGCMTSRSEPQTNYTWDTLNRLLSITGSSNISYTYDAMGNRRSRTKNGVTTRYLLDLNSSMTNVLMETDASGTPINYYVYASGMLISRIKPNGNTRYFHYDSRGSTIAMTNDAQQITHKYSYDPYGKVITMQEEDTNPFRFIGGWGVMDEGNGLSFMRARYYDQNLGRFISEDPIWDHNHYYYAGNNPITISDPQGLSPKSDRQRELYQQLIKYQRMSAEAEQKLYRLDQWEILLFYSFDVTSTIGGAINPLLGTSLDAMFVGFKYWGRSSNKGRGYASKTAIVDVGYLAAGKGLGALKPQGRFFNGLSKVDRKALWQGEMSIFLTIMQSCGK